MNKYSWPSNPTEESFCKFLSNCIKDVQLVYKLSEIRMIISGRRLAFLRYITSISRGEGVLVV